MSEQVSLAIIAISLLVITVAVVATAVILIMLGLRARKAVIIITDKSQPLISQATDTVRTVNDAAQSVKLHADGIMAKAEYTVDDVARKVKTTSDILQESVSSPVITMASVMTGVSRGLEVFSQIRKRGGNGHAK